MIKRTNRFWAFAALLFLFPALLFAQNGLNWSPAISVAGTTMGSSSPRIALLSDGLPCAVWGGSGKIWFAKMGPGGVFLPPVQVGTGGIVPGIYDFGGLDVAAGGGRVFVVFEKFTQGIFCARSEDGGATWQPPAPVYATPTGGGATISSIAVDAAGNPMVGFLKQNADETNANVQLVRSLDGGLTFTASIDASAPADGDFVCECCYQHILPTGGDTVFVAFRANRDNVRDMWVTRSDDGGGSFGTACDVDAQDWLANVCPFSGPKLVRLAGDTLLTVFMSKTGDGLRVFGSTMGASSMAKGAEFQLPPISPAVVFTQNRPDVAGSRDTVAMVYEETGFAGTGQDIVCSFSTTGAAGLAGSNLFNVSAAAGTQKFPKLAFRDGIFHLIYTDPANGLTYRRGMVGAPSGTEMGSSPGFFVKISPNPAMDFLKIESLFSEVRAEIFSASGQLMLTRFFSKNTELPLALLPAGSFFLKISEANGRALAVRRFVKS